MACVVRLVQHADLPQLRLWRNHPEVRRYMLTQHEISAQEHEQWFERAVADPCRRLLMVERGTAPLGYVQFSWNEPGRVADWGFYTVPGASKGSGAALGTAALDYAFDVLGLHKICGQALSFNAASMAFHARLGFVQEGVLRQHGMVDGVYHDMVCYGLLKADWLKSQPLLQDKNAHE